jgi:hypothetical protein
MLHGSRAPTHGRQIICSGTDIDAQCAPTATTTPRVAGTSARPEEQGSAIIIAMLVVIILSMIAMVMVGASTRSRDANRTRSNRTQALGPIDAAIATYRFGLQSKMISESTNWVPKDQNAFNTLLSGTGRAMNNGLLGPGAAVLNVGTGQVPTTARFTAQLGNGAVRKYWQIYRVLPPDGATNTDLRVWFRAWEGGDHATPLTSNDAGSRMVVATFAQGRFSDFQMLSNGPIRFDSGVEIRGPIHSNGQLDGMNDPPANDPDHPEYANYRVYTDPYRADVDVKCPLPGDAPVTTSVGKVVLPAPCTPVGNGKATGKLVSFQGLNRTFKDMRAECTTVPATVTCVSIPGATEYLVLIGGTQLQYRASANGTPFGPTLKPTRLSGAIFDHDVILAPNSNKLTTGAFTLAAYDPNGGSATIRVQTNVGTPVDPVTMTAATKGEALGLFAQGDIILDPRSCPYFVHGVIISQNGSITIGRDLMTPLPPTSVPLCTADKLVMTGAVAGKSSPTLSWSWPSKGLVAGYATRTYIWDKTLRDDPPPFTPTTGAWENATYQEADLSCFDLAKYPQGPPETCF